MRTTTRKPDTIRHAYEAPVSAVLVQTALRLGTATEATLAACLDMSGGENADGIATIARAELARRAALESDTTASLNRIVSNTTEGPSAPNAFTRQERYASTDAGTRATLSVGRADHGPSCTVRWNVDRGLGWMKGWKATRATEAEAMAFAAEKWAELVAWLERTPSKSEGRNGAAEAFSAQVAGLRR